MPRKRSLFPGEVISKQDRQMRLPWWGVVCVIVGGILLCRLFDHFGRFDLARPSLLSAAMIAIVIALRWKLKRHIWFWITMSILAALHLSLILSFHWTAKWIPAAVIVPFGIADCFVMLWILAAVGNLLRQARGEHPRIESWLHTEEA